MSIDQELADFERAANRPRGGGGTNGALDFDFSEAAKVGTLWPEGKHPLRSISAEKKVGQEYYDEKSGAMKGGNPYVEITWECFGGPMQGEQIVDRFPTKGKGTAKMQILGSACNFYDKENQRLQISSTDDLVGLEVWGTVQTEKKEYKGRPSERSVISFDGYENIDTYVLPDEEGFAQPEAAFVDEEEVGGETLQQEEVAEEVPAPPKTAVRARAGATPPWPQGKK